MKYVSGDLLSMFGEKFDVIVHGCNIGHRFGAGIAKQIAIQFPGAYKVDCATPKNDVSKLGDFSLYYHSDAPGVIVNLYTQADVGGGVQVDYDAVVVGFSRIRQMFNNLRIGIPRIGAGLGGGDWGVIENIIDQWDFDDLTCVVMPHEAALFGLGGDE